MKARHTPIRPTEAAIAADRTALTPELLAAVGARYSRNNEGLDAILAKIDPENTDKSVDSIFKMVDYGHASIADMAPVAIFIDGVTLWLAYYLWSLSPVAGGQESSTRYIQLDAASIPTAEELGIEDDGSWKELMQEAFTAYEEAVAYWDGVAEAHPELLRIPANVPPKAAERMRRNFSFDRARYALPLAAKTNVMLIMSARAWVGVCQHLLSHPLLEANRAGELIREELGLAASRLLKHAVKVESLASGLLDEFDEVRGLAAVLPLAKGDAADTARLETMLTTGMIHFDHDLAHHENRYAFMGSGIRRTAVRFSWDAVAMAEIRDLNRHRTGTKYCPLVPVGFYAATEQLEGSEKELTSMLEVGKKSSEISREKLVDGDATYVYSTLLGTQFPFEHTTTADKFLYEAELRTGTGAHYRYAKHLHDVLALWYKKFPETRSLVLEGSAEPE